MIQSKQHKSFAQLPDRLQLFCSTLNEWGQGGIPGFFILDFEQQQPLAWRLEELDSSKLMFDFQGIKNFDFSPPSVPVTILERQPVSFSHYRQAFEVVQAGLLRGDSFLVNLTMPTTVQLSGSLRDVFLQSSARYRLWLRDKFVCFSPEIFVRIQDGSIHTFPMKGTRPAAGPAAGQLLLDDPKEAAEHATIVDLMRNDLSRVAQRVRVERYRYLECIDNGRGGLWQTSSHITGQLPDDYPQRLGNLLLSLLPAGSISGAPKPSTLEIIARAEGRPRGYYTGIAGYFDGRNLDSCVLIRFLEEGAEGTRYWSGGGVTARSRAEEEYGEVLEKVYLPKA
jgi:para-aminobenzoate synthetase component 1